MQIHRKKNGDEIDVKILGGEITLNCIKPAVLADQTCAKELVRSSFPQAEVTWGPVDFLEVIFKKHRWVTEP